AAVFLADVILATFVCALAVHAGSVRLVFAMARDNNLPLARTLSHVPQRTQAPLWPPIMIGALAAAILILNINLPHVIDVLCSIPIVWANLAYLLVTLPMLLARLRGTWLFAPRSLKTDTGPSRSRLFSMGRLGLVVNAVAVVWGLCVVINIGWPRPEI